MEKDGLEFSNEAFSCVTNLFVGAVCELKALLLLSEGVLHRDVAAEAGENSQRMFFIPVFHSSFQFHSTPEHVQLETLGFRYSKLAMNVARHETEQLYEAFQKSGHICKELVMNYN